MQMPIDTSRSLENAKMVNKREEYLKKHVFPYCVESDKYEKVAKIGQGTFGEVFKARDRSNPNTYVAMKKVLMQDDKEELPITAIREIRFLQLLKHKNVVNLIEICYTKETSANMTRSTFYLVLDFCEHDLAGLLSNVNVKFSLGEIKKVIQQLLTGLYYIHCKQILHRDIKPANVLITQNGILKVADFGLSRTFRANTNGKPNRFTNGLVTLWYRPPEILLCDRNYGPPVDLWGAGCIMAEMWTRSPIMQGRSEQHQLILISKLCGSITPLVWPGVENLALFNAMKLPQQEIRKVTEILHPFIQDRHTWDLLDKLLILDPSKRSDADTALYHDFFWTYPMPCSLSNMLANHHQSMFSS